MDFLSAHDLITPTNPFAAIFFGIIAIVIVAVVVWFDTKSKKTTGLTLITGLLVVIIGVAILNLFGYYG